jgi:hypothetical protein
MSFSEIDEKTEKLIIEENENRGKNMPLSNPYH